MQKQSNYTAKLPDEHGFVHYNKDEDAVWRDLYLRQIKIVKGRACDEYIKGLEILNMPNDRVPQLKDINYNLTQATGWSVYPVPALIQFDEFFSLLAKRKFPAATFIRSREDFDYIKEPDIFHEFFGHCPMLTHPIYADFMQAYGEYSLQASKQDKVLLARLYWFTVEFGLIRTNKGMRIYGGGILSSPTETVYAVESKTPRRVPLDALEVFRTPYRIDILQPIYFVINHPRELYNLLNQDLIGLIAKARQLGEYQPLYPVE